MDDDIYIRDGESFNTASYAELPPERIEAEREELAKIAQSLPVIEDIAQWFSEQIAACNDIHNIEVSTLYVNGVKYSRTVSVEAQVLAFQLLKEKLQSQYMQFVKFSERLE